MHGIWRCREGAGGKGCDLSLLICDDMPRVPVFLIQLTSELESQSREEKVGDCRPEGFCCSMQESFWTV